MRYVSAPDERKHANLPCAENIKNRGNELEDLLQTQVVSENMPSKRTGFCAPDEAVAPPSWRPRVAQTWTSLSAPRLAPMLAVACRRHKVQCLRHPGEPRSGGRMWPMAKGMGSKHKRREQAPQGRQKCWTERRNSVARWRGLARYLNPGIPRLSPWATIFRPSGPAREGLRSISQKAAGLRLWAVGLGFVRAPLRGSGPDVLPARPLAWALFGRPFGAVGSKPAHS